MNGRPVEFALKVYGDGRWLQTEGNVGVFHRYGTSYEDHGEAGAPEFTTCIIEAADGQLHEIVPSLVRFTDGSK